MAGSADHEGCYEVILDRTLFFPEEGGQTPDRGCLKLRLSDGTALQMDVEDVQIDGTGIITHYVKAADQDGDFEDKLAEALDEETEVAGRIDWPHRFSNMQQHTGEHIFSGIVHEKYGYDNVGFHLSDNIVTMDYNGMLKPDEVTEIETLANEAIASNIRIKCYYPDDEALKSLPYRSKKELTGAVRIVEITGVDICACCAPHVAYTAEVGMLKVIGTQKYKGGIRLSILCGMRALDYVRRIQKIAKETAAELNSPMEPEDVRAGLKAVEDQLIRQKMTISALNKRLLDAELEKVKENGDDHVVIFTEDIDNLTVRNALNILVTEHPGYCAVFNRSGEAYNYIIASANLDSRLMADAMREVLNSRGGGKAEMVQGQVTASEDEVKAFANQFLKSVL